MCLNVEPARLPVPEGYPRRSQWRGKPQLGEGGAAQEGGSSPKTVGLSPFACEHGAEHRENV